MYRPPHFRVDDKAAAFRLIADHGFATLVSVLDGRALLSQLPMIGDIQRNILRGHLARANPHASTLDGARGLALFTGPQGYISPNWYEDRTRVPTWNFAAVEVEGNVRVLNAIDEIDSFLVDLSDHFESRRHDLSRDVKWTLSKLPAEKLIVLRKGIVAFEISIDRIEMKAKLSQKDRENDFNGVISALSAGDAAQRRLSDAMRDATG